MKSAEEIRIQLGLLPFDEFEYDALLRLNERASYQTRQQAIKERYRQTGRTTKLLCQALSLMSCGTPVTFLSFNNVVTKIMRDKLTAYAIELGIDTNLILHYGSNYYEAEQIRGMHQKDYSIICDH